MNATTQPTMEKDAVRYRTLFSETSHQRNGKTPAWLKADQEKAMSHFSELGFPTRKNEQWKYTNVAPLAGCVFALPETESVSKTDASAFKNFLYDQNWHSIYFVHGLRHPLSLTNELGKGVQISSLKNAGESGDAIFKTHFGHYSRAETNGFNALNQAFFRDGIFLRLEKDAVCEKPIQILHMTTASRNAMAHPRHLIVAEKNSKAVIIEIFASLSAAEHFNNTVTEIVLEEGASLDYYKIFKEGENFHIGRTEVYQHPNSSFHSWSLNVSGKLVRHDVHVELAGEGASCSLDGLYLASGSQHIDNHLLVDHKKPHGTSFQLYKGILGGKATAVFNGKTFVHPGAQKTEAQQTNKNLLLSRHAVVDTKPELEILADDVKCSHGAAVGQLDESAVFYLKSRGLSEEKTRALLAYGFASEVIRRIRLEPVKQEFDRLILEGLEKRRWAEV